MEIKARVYPLVSYQQEIEVKIKESNDKAEIAALVFDYDKVPYENNDSSPTDTDSSTDISLDGTEEPNTGTNMEDPVEVAE